MSKPTVRSLCIGSNDSFCQQCQTHIMQSLQLAPDSMTMTGYDQAITQLLQHSADVVFYLAKRPNAQQIGEIENLCFMFPELVVIVVAAQVKATLSKDLLSAGVQILWGQSDLSQPDILQTIEQAQARQTYLSKQYYAANNMMPLKKANEAYFIIKPDGIIEDLSYAMASLLGQGRETIRGRSIKEFVFFPNFFRAGVIVNANFSDDPYNHAQHDLHTIDIKGKSGKPITVNYQQQIIRNLQNKALYNVLSISEINTNPLASEELQKEAGLGPYPYLSDPDFFYKSVLRSCERSDRNGDKIAVVHVKVDDLWRAKKYFGQAIYQQFLARLGNRLHGLLRAMDLLTYQDGGFTLLLEALPNVYSAASAVEKLLSVFREPLVLRDNKIFVTANMGIAIYPFADITREQLIHDAKHASEQAKKQGSNNFLFQPSTLNKETTRRRVLAKDLNNALTHKELLLVYQPTYNLKQKVMSDFEVLLRWHHPAEGRVAPHEFIPIAEELGLIIPIGEWVLKQAFRQYHEWFESGLVDESVTMSLNVSIKELLHVSYVDYIERLMKRYQIRGKSLVLEIPEISQVPHANMLLLNLDKLQSLGIKIAIGHVNASSNLDYLRNLSITSLRFDSQLIKTIDSDPVSQYAVESILRLARELNISIVAKGVERQPQLNALVDRDCVLMQGQLLSKPLTANAFSALLELKALQYHG